MTKHTFKILRCGFLKYVWPFYIMHERVKSHKKPGFRPLLRRYIFWWNFFRWRFIHKVPILHFLAGWLQELTSTLAFCKQTFGQLFASKFTKVMQSNARHNQIKKFFDIRIHGLFKQRNLPFSYPNAYSITNLALDSL